MCKLNKKQIELCEQIRSINDEVNALTNKRMWILSQLHEESIKN